MCDHFRRWTTENYSLSSKYFLIIFAKRSDLVGEYLGETAIKTQDVLNSALGGVLVYGYRNFYVDDGYEDEYDDFDELEDIPEILPGQEVDVILLDNPIELN